VTTTVSVPAEMTTEYTSDVKPPLPGEFRMLDNSVPEGDTSAKLEDLRPGKYLVDSQGSAVLKIEENFPAGSRIPDSATGKLGKEEKLSGPQASQDSNTYRGWHKTDSSDGIPAGKYLVDSSGNLKYLVDPGINGTLANRPDLTDAPKYDAPKATLMSYIIKGVLSRDLPWGLVLIGAMIAIVLELSAIPALAFAVGLYLPLSASTPIFVGGMVRWLVDLYLKKKLASKNLSEEEIVAETDKSNGVLLGSGYIAGGAIAGILIAIFAVVPWLANLQESTREWAERFNPFFSGNYADLLSLIPFAALATLLYLVGREILFRKSE